jgi:hypothetical protein
VVLSTIPGKRVVLDQKLAFQVAKQLISLLFQSCSFCVAKIVDMCLYVSIFLLLSGAFL